MNAEAVTTLTMGARTAMAPLLHAQQKLSSQSDVSQSLHPEVMAEASRRLAWLALFYALGGVIAHFARRLLYALTGLEYQPTRAADAIGLAAVLMGLVVWYVARRRLVSPRRLLDVSLVFQVAGAFALAAARFTSAAPISFDASFALVPAECVWIAVFPLVVPNTPKRVLIASLLAASMGPLALAIAVALNGVTVDRPLAFGAYFLASNYVSALGAYGIARVVNGFNVRIKRAREIGSYELLDRIGEGGMGEVWRARHRLLVRPAAIKLIRGEVLGANQRTRDSAIRRFEREAQETATLGSPHTINVYDFGVTEDGAFYYVMELLDGMSLDRFVEQYGPMEPSRVIYVLRQVLHSLGEAHARGLVHRDIKPANIFVSHVGADDDFVKVLDFGLVKHVETADGRSMLTRAGDTAGTPAYMAPEVALGHAIDGRADLYSLGCVAYYLLTGRPVFQCDTAVATALAHVNEAPTPPSLVSEFEIPPALEAAVLKCLAKNPADRPAFAGDLSEVLDQIAAGEPWTAKAARRWWTLHRPRASAHTRQAPALPAKRGDTRRCWPRLDHRGLSATSVDAQ